MRLPKLPFLAVALLLVGSALAGCIGSDGDGADAASGGDLQIASFEDALSAGGTVAEPEATDSSIRLKVLQPASLSGLSEGEQTFTILLYDEAEETPVTDAEVGIEARMPAMGHGTSPEEDPVHQGEGIYQGMTTWSMPGDWIVNFDVVLADGTSLAFSVDATVGSGSGGDGGHDGHDGHSYDPRNPYPSYDAAASAPGSSYAPAEVTPVEDVEAFEGDVAGPADANHTFSVSDRAVDLLQVKVTWNGTLPADGANVTVTDPDGEYMGSVEMMGAEEQVAYLNWTDAALPAGDYLVNVTGQALDASYQVDTLARYEAPNLEVKVLEPVNLEKALTGERVFMILLHDVDAEEPVTSADVSLESVMPMMGHGTEGEEDPAHKFHGQYVGQTNFSMEGDWIVHLDAVLPAGEEYAWALDATAHQPDDGGDGGHDGGHDDGHDHDH